MRKTITCTFITFLAIGCSQPIKPPKLPNVKSPQVDIVDVSLKQQTIDGARVETTLTLYNPNNETIPLAKVRYTFNIDGFGSFECTDVPGLSLPAEGYQQLVLPAAIATAGQDVTGRLYTVHGQISYDPPGEVQEMMQQTGFPLPWISFSRTGMLE